MTFLNASRLAADSSVPSRPIVRCAQPMPAELTSTRTGPIDLAISTALTRSSVFVTSTLRERATDLVGECGARLLVQVGDDDLRATRGEHAGGRRSDAGGSTRDDCTCTIDVHGARR